MLLTKETHIKYKDTGRLEVSGWKKMYNKF
jgi:hypothetical protein